MLVIALSGSSFSPSWDSKPGKDFDFYDLKGILEELLQGLGITESYFSLETADKRFHPGKCAWISINETQVGIFGEIHPIVKEKYELKESSRSKYQVTIN